GIQDFYSHTNWVELGQRQPFEDADGKLRFSTDPDPGFDRMIRRAAGRTACVERGSISTFPGSDLISAARRGDRGVLAASALFLSARRQQGQCMHGLAKDEGINKDTFDSYHGRMQDPGESLNYHDTARTLAKVHSKQFVEDILGQLDVTQSLVFRTTLFEV